MRYPSLYFRKQTPFTLYPQYGAQQVLTLQPNNTDGLDSFINSGSATNYGTNASLLIGDDSGASTRYYRSVLKFDLSESGIATTAIIEDVVIEIYENIALVSGGPASWEVQARRLLRDWSESQVTRDIYATGLSWDSAMADTDDVDRSSTISGTVTLDGTAAGDFIQISGAGLVADVQAFINGTYPNYGWLIMAPTLENLGTNRAYNNFSSSDDANASKHPRITIYFREKADVYASLPQNLNLNIPAVLITFDDGYDDVYEEAFSYMNPRNMPANAYVITDYIGGGAGAYMTAAQLQEMDAAGWAICNHTTNHPNLTTKTEAEQETILGDARTALNALGLTRCSSHVAYPSGQYNADTLTAMANLGMLTGRTVGGDPAIMPDFSLYEITSFLINEATTLQDAKDFVDGLIATGRVGTVYLHYLTVSGAGVNEWSISNFRAWIDYILQKKLVSLTIDQFYTLLSTGITYRVPWD